MSKSQKQYKTKCLISIVKIVNLRDILVIVSNIIFFFKLNAIIVVFK